MEAGIGGLNTEEPQAGFEIVDPVLGDLADTPASRSSIWFVSLRRLLAGERQAFFQRPGQGAHEGEVGVRPVRVIGAKRVQ